MSQPKLGEDPNTAPKLASYITDLHISAAHQEVFPTPV
jgi:hypothetical protein